MKQQLSTLLLAKQIGASYCDTWKPTDPGDSLSKVYSTISPDKEKPLVLVLEECDKILFDILSGNIQPHKHIPIQIREKCDWNGMLDKTTDLGFYPHLILILTSNVPIEKINEKDKSLLRQGRIDKSYHIMVKSTKFFFITKGRLHLPFKPYAQSPALQELVKLVTPALVIINLQFDQFPDSRSEAED